MNVQLATCSSQGTVSFSVPGTQWAFAGIPSLLSAQSNGTAYRRFRNRTSVT